MMDCYPYMYALIILIRIIRLVAEVANKITKIMRKPSRGFLSRLLGNDNNDIRTEKGVGLSQVA